MCIVTLAIICVGEDILDRLTLIRSLKSSCWRSMPGGSRVKAQMMLSTVPEKLAESVWIEGLTTFA